MSLIKELLFKEQEAEVRRAKELYDKQIMPHDLNETIARQEIANLESEQKNNILDWMMRMEEEEKGRC